MPTQMIMLAEDIPRHYAPLSLTDGEIVVLAMFFILLCDVAVFVMWAVVAGRATGDESPSSVSMFDNTRTD